MPGESRAEVEGLDVGASLAHAPLVRGVTSAAHQAAACPSPPFSQDAPPPPQQKQWGTRVSLSSNAIAGVAAGFTSCVLTHPLDVVKTRFQVCTACAVCPPIAPAFLHWCVCVLTARDGAPGARRDKDACAEVPGHAACASHDWQQGGRAHTVCRVVTQPVGLDRGLGLLLLLLQLVAGHRAAGTDPAGCGWPTGARSESRVCNVLRLPDMSRDQSHLAYQDPLAAATGTGHSRGSCDRRAVQWYVGRIRQSLQVRWHRGTVQRAGAVSLPRESWVDSVRHL